MTDFNIDVKLSSAQATREAQKLEKELKDVETASKTAGTQGSKSINLIGAAARAAAGPLALVFGAQALTDIARASEAIGLYAARLEGITGSAESASSALAEITDVSLELGSSIEDTVRLFEALTIGASEFGATQGEILAVVETIQQAATIGGTGAEAQGNALRQLSQALAGGVVRAEEFNSIVENTPRLALEIARGFDGANGSVGRLRQLVLDGSVSSEELFLALERRAADVAAEFDKMPVTIDRALSSAGTTISLFAREADLALGSVAGSDNGLVEAFARSIQTASEEWARFLGLVQGGEVRLTATAQLGADILASQERLEELGDAYEELQARLESSNQSGRNLGGVREQIEAVEEQIATETNLLRVATERRAELTEQIKQESDLAEAKRTAAQAARDQAAAEELAETEANAERALEAVLRQLRTEEEALAASYAARQEIILQNTQEGSERQRELLRQSEALYAEELAQLQQDRQADQIAQEEALQEELAQLAITKRRETNRMLLEAEQERRDAELAEAFGFEDLRQVEELQREERHQQELIEVRTRGAGKYQKLLIDLANFEKKNALDKSKFVIGTLQSIVGPMAAESEKAFEISKGLALATATVETAKGVATALGAYDYVGAALIAAMGAAQIATIQQQQFSGGSTSSSGVSSLSQGSSSGASGLVIPDAPIITGEQATGPATQIVQITGDVFTTDSDEFADRVGPALFANFRDQIAEQDEILIPEGSAQAASLGGGGG